jgi:putative ABC transport system permease protein
MLQYYLRVATRTLRRKKTYGLTSIVGLAVGMASCLLILFFVLDELSFDQYHSRKDRIYRLATEVHNSTYGGIAKVNGPWGPAAQEEIAGIEHVTRFVICGRLLMGQNDKRFYESNGFYADSTVFKVFSFDLLAGNAESALSGQGNIVITKTLAEKYFGNENALGQTLRINNEEDYKVTGIMNDVPSNSHFTFDFLISMASHRHPQRDSWIQWNQFYTYFLLREGTDPKAVAENIKPILRKNMEAETADNYSPFLQPLTDIHLYSHLFREITPNSDVNYIYIFSSIALLILLISCANFVNMATAQASTRAKEIGVRKVNGAIRKQLIIQFLLEATLICLAALCLAHIFTLLTLPVLNDVTGKNIRIDYLANPIVLISIIGFTLFTALLAGSYPSFYQAALKPIQVLKGKWSPGGSTNLRKTLVVIQFGISSVLVIASVLILQQLHYIQNKSLGFDPQQIITIPIQHDILRMNYETVKRELFTHPGVMNVSLSGNLPGGGDWGIPSIPEGFTAENAPPMRVMAVDHSFIETFGMKVVSGRAFSDKYSTDTATYLINEEAARQLQWSDPLNKSIGMPAIQRSPEKVVGVIQDFHFRSLHEKIGPILFFIPPRSWYSLYSIKIDARQTEDVLKFIEKKWSIFDPDHPFTYNFFDEAYSSLHQQETRLARIVGYFTAVGIFLACLGLYSLASYTTEQRTKEIGIRKVVGASTAQIVTLLSKQYLALVLIGFFIAIPLAWWVLQSWLESFAYHVEFSPLLIFACGLTSLLIALLTVGYRAVNAATVNPVESLKNE